MKKRYICMVISVLLTFVLLLPLSGCYFAAHPDVEGLTATEVRKIRWVRYNATRDAGPDIKSIEIQQYLGEYNGKKVVKISDGRYIFDDAMPELREEIIDGIFVGPTWKSEFYAVYMPGSKDQKESVIYLREAYKQGIFTKADIVRVAEAEQALLGPCGYYTEHHAVDGLTDEQVRQIRWASRVWMIGNDRLDQIEIVRKIGEIDIYNSGMSKTDNCIVLLIRDNRVENAETVEETIDGVYIGQRKSNEIYCLYRDKEYIFDKNIIALDEGYRYKRFDKTHLEKIAELVQGSTQSI